MLSAPSPTSGLTRSHYVFGWAYTLVCVTLVRNALTAPASAPASVTHATAPVYSPSPAVSEVEWFRRVKPYCNTVEIQTLQQQSPAPETVAGAGYHAACFALAGRIDDARRVVDQLPHNQRLTAVGIVFEVGHPVADAGDDRSAGPIMELVVDYWPSHYMALYHAGAAEYMLGQRDLARHNLKRFLQVYNQPDGWTANAKTMLERLDDRTEPPLHRLPEPGS